MGRKSRPLSLPSNSTPRYATGSVVISHDPLLYHRQEIPARWVHIAGFKAEVAISDETPTAGNLRFMGLVSADRAGFKQGLPDRLGMVAVILGLLAEPALDSRSPIASRKPSFERRFFFQEQPQGVAESFTYSGHG